MIRQQSADPIASDAGSKGALRSALPFCGTLSRQTCPADHVTVITRNEAANIAARARVRRAGPTRSSSSTRKAPTTRSPIARRFTDRSSCGRGPATSRRRTSPPRRRRHDWILSLDADERVSPALAERDSRAARRASRAPPATGFRASRFHLGRWIRSTDWYPDYQLRLYDRRRARWTRPLRPRIGDAPTGRSGGCAASCSTTPYRDLSHHLQTMDRYTTLAARQMFEDGRRAGWFDVLILAASGVLSQLRPARRLSRRHAGPHRLGHERVLRRPRNSRSCGSCVRPPHRHRTDLARRTEPSPPDGPRSADAQPQSRARRAPGGRALSPRARGTRPGTAGAAQRGRSLGGVEAVAHHPAVEAADRARARSARRLDGGLALSFSAPDPRPRDRRVTARRLPSAERTRSRAGSTVRSISSSPRRDAIRHMLEHDGIPGSRIVVVHDGIDVAKIQRLPARRRARRILAAARRAAPRATSARSSPHKGQKHLIDAMPQVLREVPDAHLVIFGEGELRPRSNGRSRSFVSRSTSCCRASARTCCSWSSPPICS